MREYHICVIVPTYNNAGTIVDVLRRILKWTERVIVVLDGCTDDSKQRIAEASLAVDVMEHSRNLGKGRALITGFERAIHQGNEFAVTIDGDGQHYPEDLPVMMEAFLKHPGALLVGSRNLRMENMPSQNTFANKFSNFWFFVQTGLRLPDTQTGYRLYPLIRHSFARFVTSRYEAELELLVIAAWKNIDIVPIPVRVHYPPQGERVSHFRPFRDFLRISVLNTILCFFAVVYGWPNRLIYQLKKRWRPCF